MANRVGSVVTARVIALVAGIQAGGESLAARVRAQNVGVDLADKSQATQYPAIQVYCEKIVNSLTEKFRSFSGAVLVAVEIRHSQDRLEGLQDALEEYADLVMEVLNTKRGDWGDGLFYGGEYQAAFGAVKHGGRNFLQTVKITFEIGVSRN